MGLLSKITRSITKPIKKIVKSDLGKLALLYGAYQFGPAALQPGQGLRGLSGWQKALSAKAPWLYSAGETSLIDPMGGLAKNAMPYTSPSGGIIGKAANTWKGMSGLQKAGTVALGAAGVGAATLPDEEDVPEVDDVRGHADYLSNRGMFEDEWAEWLVSTGKAGTKEEALVMVRENPMFSGGGRVKAQGGLFAGQMPGRHPSMNPMNQMNQGLGAPNLGSRSMGMNPGMGGGGGQDPRMAQMMQTQKLQGGRGTGAVPSESPDTELIQLIKMLSSLGIPMEQLRGRTKEELVEMLVSVKGKMGGEPDVKETAGVIEEEDIREQEVAGGGLMRTGYALGTPIIPSKDGMQLDMRESGGYQPHGKAEKHDDVRALLAQGEFVMTSDAVKGMGGGDREAGAKKMYNLMHNMEAMA
jgi:hypothetical protein